MAEIEVKGIVKAFEVNKNILDGVSFDISRGERVGLLGKNGVGKTTLFRIMAGEIESDQGEVVFAGGKKAGLISQIPKYPRGYTTEDVLKEAQAHVRRMKLRMEELEREMQERGDGARLAEYDRLLAAYETAGGYTLDIDRNKVAGGLGITDSMRSQLFDSLSGGEKTRVNLARLILEDTEILLLDEPTNHLDMNATEWLEDYLLKYKGTVLVISHDRYFLDRVVTRIVEIVAGKCEFYSGNYSFYVEEKEARFQEQLKRYEKEQKELKRLGESFTRLYQWGTGNEMLMKKAFAIESRMERLKTTDRPKKERAIRARFGEKEFRGDEVAVIHGLKKSFGERTLFSDVDLAVEGGERIALLGDNGTGKSTFLKLLMQEEAPDEGSVRFGPSVKLAYLPQIIKFSDPERSAYDTMIYDAGCSPQQARDRLGAFKFSGEDVFKPVSALSGGEQSRLRLCMLMDEKINLLILDEPTNHLDIASREWMEQALEDYGEALLFVSHDRYFISRFATRIWVLENVGITDFRGSFEKYREFAEREVKKERARREVRRKETKRRESPSIERQIALTEKAIAEAEERSAKLDGEIEANASDYQRLSELFEEKARAETELEELYRRWESLSEQVTGDKEG